jgi:hypothetical protein
MTSTYENKWMMSFFLENILLSEAIILLGFEGLCTVSLEMMIHREASPRFSGSHSTGHTIAL